ncbi:MAG: hypothetical protein K1X51_14045 [Rhodospirillaceae bacterium]|nr:hypothetical protein [Rhodospirillaceae bacterium]
MIRTVTRIHSRHGDEHPLTPRMVAIAGAVYCPTAVAIGLFDNKFLLMAWIMAGFLGLSLYLALDRRMPLINPGTLFFSATVLGCLAGFLLDLA